MHQGSLCKGYVVKPCLLTLVVFEGLIGPRQKGIITRGLLGRRRRRHPSLEAFAVAVGPTETSQRAGTPFA
jgi:hypothetical protein